MVAANPIRGDVPVEGQELTLNFGVNGLCALEAKLGLTVEQIGRLFGAQMSLTHLRACFWAALQEHHEGMNEVEAGRIMSKVGAAKSGSLIFQAFAVAFPDAQLEGEGGEADPQTAAGTG